MENLLLFPSLNSYYRYKGMQFSASLSFKLVLSPQSFLRYKIIFYISSACPFNFHITSTFLYNDSSDLYNDLKFFKADNQ